MVHTKLVRLLTSSLHATPIINSSRGSKDFIENLRAKRKACISQNGEIVCQVVLNQEPLVLKCSRALLYTASLSMDFADTRFLISSKNSIYTDFIV